MENQLAQMYFTLFWELVKTREKLKENVYDGSELSVQNKGQLFDSIKVNVYPYLDESSQEIFNRLFERFNNTTSF